MDGTLTESLHDFPAMKRALGLPEDCDILSNLAQMDPAEAAPKYAQLHQLELEVADQSRAAEGAADLLAFLQKRGCHLAILTRNNRQCTEHTLAAAGLNHFFAEHLILTREDGHAKPAPGGIFTLLDRTQSQPISSLMLGDYLFDLEAGRAAGVHNVLIHPQNDVAWSHLADAWFPHPAALLNQLQINGTT